MSTNSKKSTYLIIENESLPAIFQPLKSKRIKYTCFDVSRNFIILGATSGGLYVFKREPCVFLQLVPNKEGAINNISMSWDEKFIAFSTLKGVACVLELQEHNEARIINRNLEHEGSIVTTLVWARETNQLYVGDNIGRLSVINVSLFLNKNIFHIPAYMFMKLDSSVVQISCFEEYLLVSTKTRSYVCDTTKEIYRQIGTQLRDGAYGATFLNSDNGLKIYCARPGSRLWEADISGTVKRTHQFKKALATQSVAVVKLQENVIIQNIQSSWSDQSFNFCVLVGIFDKYLLTFKSDGVYVFDPITAEVILWSDYYQDIVDARCINDIVYLWTSSGQIHSFAITPLNNCLVHLYFLGKYQLCVDVLERFLESAKSFSIMSKVSCLVGLKDNFPGITKNSKLCSYLDKLNGFVKEKQLFPNFDSGIFLVDTDNWKKCKLNLKNSKLFKKRKITRSRSLSDLNKLTTNISKESKQDYITALSLPVIKFSIEESESQILNSQNYFSDHNLSWNGPLTGSLIHQIPCLSLTSPDLIQSTILELSQSVKKKLCISTKTLQDKWHFIEEKFGMSKENSSYDSGYETSVQIQATENDVKHEKKLNGNSFGSEDHIVYQPPQAAAKKDHCIDITEINVMCDTINNGGESEDLIFCLFDTIIEQTIILNEMSSQNENMKKSFPFKQCFSEKYESIITNIFCNSFKNKTIIKYLNRFQKDKLHILESQTHPKLLKEIHGPDALVDDTVLSNIVLVFSEVIDPSSILDLIANLMLPCSFLSWSIVLDIFQEKAFSFFAVDKESPNYVHSPLPFLLNMLFLTLRLEQIASASEMAKQADLKLYHISYLVMKLSIHLEFTGIKYANCIAKCNKLFLSFVDSLLKSKCPQINDLTDPETLYHLELAFFSINKSSTTRCICDYPLLDTSKNVRYGDLGRLIFSLYLLPFSKSKREQKDNNKLVDCSLKLIAQFGDTNCLQEFEHFWFEVSPGEYDFCIHFLFPDAKDNKVTDARKKIIYDKIILLIQSMPDLFSMLVEYFKLEFNPGFLPFIVQFDVVEDIAKLDCRNDVEVWKTVFEYSVIYSEGVCCLCQNRGSSSIKVNWNDISVLVLKYLGTSEALKLLMSYADYIPSEEIDISFFRLFFLKHMMEEEGTENLSLLDTYMRTFKPINDSLEYSLDDSLQKIGDKDIFKIDVNQDICSLCSLNLSSSEVSKERKIRAFRCKHVFHIVCVSLANSLFECPLCSKKQ